MFKAFKHDGVRYLAVERPDGVGIVDAAGNFYGSWLSLESFLDSAKKKTATPIGKAQVAIRGAAF